ncbi:MAG: class I SAM-dependent methyltransferase [Gammaproteobacteria bacterium]
MFASTTDTAALPGPSDEALQHSASLVRLIRESIQSSGQPLSLGQYVHLALYAPELGYYAAGTRKFGEQGDFVTAPELGSVYAQCIARGIARVFSELKHTASRHANVLELGAGSGQFAYDCLQALHALDAVPARYQILEVSADLRERQSELLATLPDNLGERVEWLSQPPEQSFEGVIFANEVIDALPMERFGVTENGQIRMETIGVTNGELCSQPGEATPVVADAVASLRSELGDDELWSRPYVSEIRTGLHEWLRSITANLSRGAVLMVDYGADAAELYRGDRSVGTLMCHYRHRAHDNVLLWPGLQDITSWVDFTQVAQAGVDLGFDLNGYTSQAHMLIDFELDAVVSARFDGASTTRQLRLASEVKQLTLPGEMGERFKAISLSRGITRGLLSPAHMGLERRL